MTNTLLRALSIINDSNLNFLKRNNTKQLSINRRMCGSILANIQEVPEFKKKSSNSFMHPFSESKDMDSKKTYFMTDIPPSTPMVCPVSQLFSRQNKAACAISSGEPIFCNGWRLAAFSLF